MMVRLFAILLAGLASLAHAYDCTGNGNENVPFPGCASKHCDTYSEDLCKNGWCINIGDDPYFRCECDEDHQNLTPQNCVKNDSPSCDNSPCGQNALCMVSGDQVVCLCPGPTGDLAPVEHGTPCSTCDMDTCGFNARCYDRNPGVECVCKNGSNVPEGIGCLDSYPPVPCSVNTCDSHATCEKIYKDPDPVCKCMEKSGYVRTGNVGDCTFKTSTSSSTVMCNENGHSCGRGEQCSVEGGFIVCKCNGRPIVPGSGVGCN